MEASAKAFGGDPERAAAVESDVLHAAEAMLGSRFRVGADLRPGRIEERLVEASLRLLHDLKALRSSLHRIPCGIYSGRADIPSDASVLRIAARSLVPCATDHPERDCRISSDQRRRDEPWRRRQGSVTLLSLSIRFDTASPGKPATRLRSVLRLHFLRKPQSQEVTQVQ